MQWVWLVLGAVLVVIVGAVVYLFFVARPRNTVQVTASMRVLAREVHGRAPELIVPATCVAATAPNEQQYPGLGVLALTEQAVVFAAANPDRTLLIPRANVTRVDTTDSLTDTSGSQLRKRLPMLTLAWRGADDVRQAAFTLADPGGFITALRR